MAPTPARDRLQMFDGERLREIWVPSDGPGDGEVDLVTSGHTRTGGHPTWKIFASDLENGVQRASNRPPMRVYLDDKACYEVLSSGLFSANQLGKCWPYDFTQVGKLRATRPNRGRAACLDDGKIATSFRSNKIYYFKGASSELSKKRKATHIDNDDHDQDEIRADVGTASPISLAIERMDEDNNAHARRTIDNSEDAQVGADADSDAAAQVVKRRRMHNDLFDKPLDQLDKVDLEKLREEYVKAVEEAEQLEQKAAERHYEASRARLQVLEITKDRDELLERLQDVKGRLVSKHRDHHELALVLKRHNQDSLVVKSMLDKTKKELDSLKNEHAVDKVRTEADGEEAIDKLRREHESVLELCRTLYIGHSSSKAIIDDIRQETFEDLPDNLKPFVDIQEVVDDGIGAIKTDMEEKGIGNVLDDIIMASDSMAQEDSDPGHSSP